MTSTYTPLGVEKMVTGENAGTWGTKTNTNLEIIEQISGGYLGVDIAGGAGTTTLSKSDGATGSAVATRVLKFTGSITGNRIVTMPVLTENFYLIQNATTDGAGTPTVQLKAASGAGATVTWAASDKGWKMVYFDGVATNTGVYDTGFSTTAGDVTLTGSQTLSNKTLTTPIITSISNSGTVTVPSGADTLVAKTSTDTLTNKTLTAPKIGTSILDTNGAELFLLTATSSAVNEFTLANAATGNGPILSATGETNVDINLNPKGTGVLKSATAAVKIAGLETMWVPSSAMYGATTNPAEALQVETTALRPDMKVLDFDASTDEFAQFSVAFPKSWNEGTVTYRVYWTPSTTNTGDCIFGLQGVSVGDGDTIDVVYGTAATVTDAGIGTIEDQQISAISSAVTITAAAATEQTYFQLYRDANAGGDTYTGDARVLGIKIFYTTDAANDA